MRWNSLSRPSFVTSGGPLDQHERHTPGKTAANFIEIWYLREEDNLDGNGPQYRIKGRRLTASSGPVPDTMSVWSSGGRSYVSTRGTDTTLFRSDNCGL